VSGLVGGWYCDEVLWQKQSIGIWFATTLEIPALEGLQIAPGIWESSIVDFPLLSQRERERCVGAEKISAEITCY